MSESEASTRVVRFERLQRGRAHEPGTGGGSKRILVVAAVLAIAAMVGASTLTVNEKPATSALFAERYTIAEQFAFADSALWPAKQAWPAIGTDGDPAEMTAALPDARTALPADQWVYSVTVQESAPGRVGGGNFTVELYLDQARLGSVVIGQQTADASAVEGVRASFGIGAQLGNSSLYYVVVKPVATSASTAELALRSNPAQDLTWLGVGGSIDGQKNPAFTLAAGTTLRIKVTDADGITHNVGVKDAAGTLVSPPGWSADINDNGDQQSITWTPAAAGTYTYLCKYHATTMKGTITVS